MSFTEQTFVNLLNLSKCVNIGVNMITLSNIIESIGTESQKTYLNTVIIPSLHEQIPDKWQRDKHHINSDVIEMIINMK